MLQQISQYLTIGKRWFLPLRFILIAAFLSIGTLATGADGFSVAKLMDELDRPEQEIVTRAVKARIPELFGNETDQKIATAMISSFDSLREDKINDAIGTVLSSTADIYDFKGVLFRRFGENTYAGSLLRQADAYPEISKKIISGLLNKNTNWTKLSNEVLTDYATKNYEALLQEGKDFWRDAMTQIINPPEILGKVGLDPIDLYLQGVDGWIALVEQERRSWNRDVLDCVYRSYQKLDSDFVGMDMAQAGCDFLNDGSFLGGLTQFMGDKRTSTAALGELGLSPTELIPLMQKYQQQNPDVDTNTRARFASWVEREFDRVAKQNARAHTANMVDSIDASEQQFEAGLSAQLAKINGAYYQAILDALGQEEMMRRHRASVGQPPVDEEEGGIGEDDEANGLSVAEARRIAVNSCEPERVSQALDLLESKGANASAVARARQRGEDIGTAIALLNRARADYASSNTESAADALTRARAIMQKVSNADTACTSLIGAISAGLSQVAKAETAIEKIDSALGSCDAEKIRGYISSLENREKLPAALQSSLQRMESAILAIDPFELLFAEAQGMADRGELAQAKREALELKAELDRNQLRNCPEYGQVTGFLRELDASNALRTAARQAANDCNVGQLQTLLGRATGPNYADLRGAIGRAIEACAVPEPEPEPEPKLGPYEGSWISVASYWSERAQSRSEDNSRTVIISYDSPTSGTFRNILRGNDGVQDEMGRWSMALGSRTVNIVWTDAGGARSTYRFLRLEPDFAVLETDIDALKDLDGTEGGKLVVEFRRQR